MGAVRAPPEPTLALAQARARWGADVVLAGLFRPGPDPAARTALTKAVSRRTNRRRSALPARVLVAVDDDGRALICPLVPDAQGGHPSGEDIYAGPFEELGAVPAGELSIVVLLDADRPVVLEAVWLDHDAATVAALLAGEPLPAEPDNPVDDDDTDDDDDDEGEPEPSSEELLAEADAAQARADSLRALAAGHPSETSGPGAGPAPADTGTPGPDGPPPAPGPAAPEQGGLPS